MSTILIKNVLFNDALTDILIDGQYIQRVGFGLEVRADTILEGTGKALIPGFVNTHTHAAMTLFRGFADDMPLEKWLTQKIWPYEAHLTPEDVYWGSKLACLEMIKTGTTTFLDMYFHLDYTAQAAEEMGLRAFLSSVCFDHFNPEIAKKTKKANLETFSGKKPYSDRIHFTVGPHAIYTVSGDTLRWANRLAEEQDTLITLHLAETQTEVANSIKDFGLSPVRYLHKLGLLSPRLVVAHCLWIDEEEIKMLGDYGVKIAHNPASNMKLASGYRFNCIELEASGATVGLATDGCSSSNNLDMVEAMKLASLMGKAWREDPEAMPAPYMLQLATRNGADILRLKAGEIAPGYLADICLVDLKSTAFTPNFNTLSNLVYAANGNCVDTVICDGKILMQNRKVPGEEEIREQAARIAYDLMKRKK